MTKNSIDDPRIDPRIRRIFAQFPVEQMRDHPDRSSALASVQRPESIQRQEAAAAFLNSLDSEEIAPLSGLRRDTIEIESQPDSNTIKMCVIRPDNDETLPCVYYAHGGGMMLLSCFLGVYQCWARMLAHQGVAVVMPDFRNCLAPSSAPEVEPFPAGLNDCLSGLRWLHSNASQLHIDPKRIVISGESGGGNLTLATALKLKRDGDLDLISGIYAFCPFIAGQWPQERFPSSTENDGILIFVSNNLPAVAYGIEALDEKNPLAWPSFATEDDVRGFPRTNILVNEFDPLRDEGIAFYRLLLAADVAARCQISMGTIHASELMVMPAPDIGLNAAANLAYFAKQTT